MCVAITPWSRTSHIVKWIAPSGRIDTVVKGAVRPKSLFLGQYDLNYTCDIVYYVSSRGGLHALRECAPSAARDWLRRDWRKLALAAHVRAIAAELAPPGGDDGAWLAFAERELDALETADNLLQRLVAAETGALRLAGLAPEVEAESGGFALRGERSMPVPAAVARCIKSPLSVEDEQILLDTARVIGVFYGFHLDGTPQTRRGAVEAAARPARRNAASDK